MVMRHPSPLAVLLAVATLGSGVINVYSLIGHGLSERIAFLQTVFPLQFLELSRFLTLVCGFALIISSVNVYRRKR